MRIIGIDPGLRNMGWGVIEARGSRLSHVANGTCHSEGKDLAARLLSLHRQLTEVLELWQPEQAAVEQTFDAAARRTKAKNDPALALQALGVSAPAAGSTTTPAAPAQ